MSDYRNSDYALNKFSEGIVYRFSGEIRIVTMEDYLRENPDKSKEDFEKLKALSDQIYLEELREENTYRKRTVSMDKAGECDFGFRSFYGRSVHKGGRSAMCKDCGDKIVFGRETDTKTEKSFYQAFL